MQFPLWLRALILVSFAIQTVAWVWGTILDLRSRQAARVNARQQTQARKVLLDG